MTHNHFTPFVVMAGLDPTIHALLAGTASIGHPSPKVQGGGRFVDGRVKPGHDEKGWLGRA